MNGYHLVDEGPNHITMRHHSNNHELKIAKSALSPKTIQTIKAYAKGGDVNYSVSPENTIDTDKAKAFKAAFNQESEPSQGTKQEPSKVQNAAPVQHFDDGGDVKPQSQAPININIGTPPGAAQMGDPSVAPNQMPNQSGSGAHDVGSFIGKYGVAPLMQYGKDWTQNISDRGSDIAHGISDLASGVKQGAGIEPQGTAPQAQPASVSQQPHFQNVDLSANGSMENKAPTQQPKLPDMEGQYRGAMNEVTQGMKGEAEAKSALANSQAPLFQQAASNLQAQQYAYQGEHQKLVDDYNAIKKDYADQQIDPKRAFSQLSTPGQISAMLGILVSGIGSGLTGQPNMAMSVINNALDRDIEAQKANMGKYPTLLEANLKQEGNLQHATEVTQLQQKAIMEAKLEEMAAKATDPTLQAQLRQKLGQFQIANMGALNDLALRKAFFQTTGNASQMTGSRIAPLINIAPGASNEDKTKMTDELNEFQKAENVRKMAVEAYDDLHGKLLGGTFSPEDRKSAIDSLEGEIAKLTLGKSSPELAKKMTEAILPSRIEGEETANNRFRRLDEMLFNMVPTKTLERFSLKPAKAPLARSARGVPKTLIEQAGNGPILPAGMRQ